VDGSVVNITSMSGFVPLTRVPFYSDAFAAIESYTKSAAFIFGHYGLGRVNNVGVGFLVGTQNRSLLLAEDGTPTARGLEILNATSQRRFLSPPTSRAPCCIWPTARSAAASTVTRCAWMEALAS